MRPSPVLDVWKATIDGWLEADREAPRKQRHTARRVWQRLVDEHDAQVGESTVRRYVAEARRRQPAVLVEVKVPQTASAGRRGARSTSGRSSFFLAGVLIDGWMFVFRLSASGRGFHRVYLNQAQQVFLDGHVRAFEHMGGVPGRIRYDNLKPAVVRVLKGRDRAESERFIAMRSHYGFDSFFCQPGLEGAHEKGGVEGEVGRFRRRHLVPVPRVDTMAELNELVAAGDAADDRRRIAGRAITVGEHFALEAQRLAAAAGRAVRHDAAVDAAGRRQVAGVCPPVLLLGAGPLTSAAASRCASAPRPSRSSTVPASSRRMPGWSPRAPSRWCWTTTWRCCGSSRRPARRHRPGPSPGLRGVQRRPRAASGHWPGAGSVIRPAPAPWSRCCSPTAACPPTRSAPRCGPASTSVCVDPDVVIVEARRAAADHTAAVVPIGDGLARYDRPLPTIAHYDQLLEAR